MLQLHRGPCRKRKPVLGVVRCSRRGRSVPGSGRLAEACAPRACGTGWAPGGTLQVQRLFINKLPSLSSYAFRRAE